MRRQRPTGLTSEQILQCELDLPVWKRRAGHAPERACPERSPGVRKLRRIERIEKLRPEQQRMRFEPRNLKRLRSRKVPRADARSHYRTTRRVAILQHRSRECGRVEPLIER